MDNKFFINLENKLHGIHTRLKELHYSSSSLSMHTTIDDFDGEFCKFDDAIMENAQAIWGFIEPGDLSPVLPEAKEIENLLTDIRGILANIKKTAGDDLMWTGILNIVDDFWQTVNRYIYLVKIIKKSKN